MKLKIAYAFLAGYCIGAGLMMIFMGAYLEIRSGRYEIVKDIFYARS